MSSVVGGATGLDETTVVYIGDSGLFDDNHAFIGSGCC